MQRIGIIGGSGFGEAFPGDTRVVETPWGQASVQTSRLKNGPGIVFVARHGAGHALPPHSINHRANIAALRDLGVGGVLATAAVGSLRADIAPSDFVIPDDLIDWTRGDVVTWSAPGQVQHTDMGAPYDAHLREALLRAAPGAGGGTIHPRGTYVCVSGPRYETRAEIKMLAQWGGDIVGMTGAPEAILCREIGLPYAGVAIITNYGCGLVTGETLSHADVEQQMAQSRDALTRWLERTARALAGSAL